MAKSVSMAKIESISGGGEKKWRKSENDDKAAKENICNQHIAGVAMARITRRIEIGSRNIGGSAGGIIAQRQRSGEISSIIAYASAYRYQAWRSSQGAGWRRKKKSAMATISMAASTSEAYHGAKAAKRKRHQRNLSIRIAASRQGMAKSGNGNSGGNINQWRKAWQRRNIISMAKAAASKMAGGNMASASKAKSNISHQHGNNGINGINNIKA